MWCDGLDIDSIEEVIRFHDQRQSQEELLRDALCAMIPIRSALQPVSSKHFVYSEFIYLYELILDNVAAIDLHIVPYFTTWIHLIISHAFHSFGIVSFVYEDSKLRSEYSALWVVDGSTTSIERIRTKCK